MLLGSKLIEKILDPCNSKEHYESFTRKKDNNTKLIKQSKIITYQTKTFENPNIVDKKSLLQNIQKIHINYPKL